MQRYQLFAGAIAGLVVLQQLGHPQNAGQRIVQFVSEASDHLSHRGQAFALNDLLLHFFFRSYIAHGNDDARRFAFRVEHGTRRPQHGAPAAVLVSRPVFRLRQRSLFVRDRAIERDQFWRIVFSVLNFLSHQYFRPVAEQIADARAYKRVGRFCVQHQDQVGKTLQQVAAEFFLTAQLPFHRAFFGDVHQRSLIAHNFSRVYRAGGGVHANRDAPVFSP